MVSSTCLRETERKERWLPLAVMRGPVWWFIGELYGSKEANDRKMRLE